MDFTNIFKKKADASQVEIERLEKLLSETDPRSDGYKKLAEALSEIKKAKSYDKRSDKTLDPNTVFKSVVTVGSLVLIMVFEVEGHSIVTKAWPLVSRNL